MLFLLYFAGMLAAAYLALRSAARIDSEAIAALLFFAFVMIVILLASLLFEVFEHRKTNNRK